ncbi:hypothetical protein ACTOVN_06515 [Arcanobacterium canis]
MSDEPRLTRRMLKEQGKLTTRPANAVPLTETAELRLGRMSRKEIRMREREEARTAALEAQRAIEQARAAKEAQEAPEHDTAEHKMNVSGPHAVVEDEKLAEEVLAEPATEESPAVVDEGIQQAVSEETPAESPERKSVFDRFEKKQEEDDSVDDDEPSLHQRLTAMTSRDSVTIGADEEPGILKSQAQSDEIDQDVHATEKVAAVRGESGYVDFDDEEDDEPSTFRSVLGWILIIIIGVLVGYLIGTWVNQTFFSAGVYEPATTALLL